MTQVGDGRSAVAQPSDNSLSGIGTSFLRLDGQCAIVTGAGRGIGRAHAMLLAERGAAVVVNDLGTSVDGAGSDATVAEAVASEIRSAGGQAVAVASDVAQADGAGATIEVAQEAFGRLDIVVHNAGSVVQAKFCDTDPEIVRRQFEINVLAAFHLCQPAWRLMRQGGYGRIVLTSSGAIFGSPGFSAYGAAKFGVVGLMRSMHMEAMMEPFDLKVNAVAPMAITRMTTASNADRDRYGDLMDPINVAAAVAYLASPGCTVSGECFRAGATFLARCVLELRDGWATGRSPLLPEEVADRIRHIVATDDPPLDVAQLDDLVYLTATTASGECGSLQPT